MPEGRHRRGLASRRLHVVAPAQGAFDEGRLLSATCHSKLAVKAFELTVRSIALYLESSASHVPRSFLAMNRFTHERLCRSLGPLPTRIGTSEAAVGPDITDCHLHPHSNRSLFQYAVRRDACSEGGLHAYGGTDQAGSCTGRREFCSPLCHQQLPRPQVWAWSC